MNKMLSRVSKCLNLKKRLPQTRDEFEAWTSDVFERAGFPDSPEYRSQLCSILMHISPTQDRMPIDHFVKAMRKLKTNFVALEVIEQLREEQKAKDLKAEQDARAKDAEEIPVSPI